MGQSDEHAVLDMLIPRPQARIDAPPKLPAPKVPHVYVERGLGTEKVDKR